MHGIRLKGAGERLNGRVPLRAFSVFHAYTIDNLRLVRLALMLVEEFYSLPDALPRRHFGKRDNHIIKRHISKFFSLVAVGVALEYVSVEIFDGFVEVAHTIGALALSIVGHFPACHVDFVPLNPFVVVVRLAKLIVHERKVGQT